MLFYQTFGFTIHGKIQKSNERTINLKYQFQHGIKYLNYLMGHFVCLIFKIALNKF